MKFLKKILISSIGLAMAVGVGITAYSSDTLRVEAAEESWSHTFASGELKQAGGNVTLNGVLWSYDSATYLSFNNSQDFKRGFQIGSKNKPQTSEWTISTPLPSFGANVTINSVTVNAATSGESVLRFYKDNTQVGNDYNLTTTSADYTCEYNASGFDVLKIGMQSSSKAMYIKSISINYEAVDAIPTKAVVSFADGIGEYYNGTNANSTLSTEDLIVETVDDDGNVAETYADGVGYTLTINDVTVDASESVQEIEFEGWDAGQYSMVVKVGEFVSDDSCKVTIIQKAIKNITFTTNPTSVFYSHVDKFVFDGVVKTTFNDNSTTSSLSNHEYIIRSYNESADNHAGEEISLPTHDDDTLNVLQDSKYVLDFWHKDYPNDMHLYREFDVVVPTLSIADNYDGVYYVGVSRTLDVTVTLTCGEEYTVLTPTEYILSHTVINPVDTTTINVTASLLKNGEEVLTSAPLVITPVESTRVLNELVVDDQTFEAGDYFVLPTESVMLSYTENNVEDIIYLEQEQVTFTTSDDVVLDENTRLLKSYAGSVTATYSEGVGEGKTVSTTFTLTINDAQVVDFVEPEFGDYEKVTTMADITDGEYLLVANDKYLFNGDDAEYGNVSVTPSNDVITYSDEIAKNSVTITAVDGGYTVRMSATNEANPNKYIYGSNGNSNDLNFSDDEQLITIEEGKSEDTWALVYGNNKNVFSFNSVSDQMRFKFYKPTTYSGSSYYAVSLYKRTSTEAVGDAVSYLKSVIDAYRLNNDLLSICDADSSIYSSEHWIRAKEVYINLSEEEKTLLAVQDYFGEVGKTYVDTYEMLLSLEPTNNLANNLIGDISNNDLTLLFGVVSVGLLSTILLTINKSKKRFTK